MTYVFEHSIFCSYLFDFLKINVLDGFILSKDINESLKSGYEMELILVANYDQSDKM